MTDTYRFGDWVTYDPGYRDPEIGRVTTDKGDSAFVCYSCGCTASRTPKKYLRRATMEEILAAPRGIGYHRFNSHCPNAKECPVRDDCDAAVVEDA